VQALQGISHPSFPNQGGCSGDNPQGWTKSQQERLKEESADICLYSLIVKPTAGFDFLSSVTARLCRKCRKMEVGCMKAWIKKGQDTFI